jgi:lambda family phage portal protein
MAQINFNIVDKVVDYFSPGAGLRRLQKRFAKNEAEKLIRSYDAASKGRRTKDWKAPNTSATAEIHIALQTLRNRAREMERNNPYAESAIDKIATNIVGTGIIPTPLISSRPQEKKIKQLWTDWAEKTKCDWDGHLNFYGLQDLIMRTVALSGECIVRKRIVKDPSLPLPLQLQVLEADFIDTFKHGPTDNEGWIFYGVEFNKQRKVVAYWLYEEHPGDSFLFNFNFKSNRYPVEDVIHIFEKKRPGQFRGVPIGASSMLRLKDVDEYSDAQLVRQKIAACFSAFVYDSSTPMPAVQTQDDDGLTDKLEPGTIQHLTPGKQITFSTPPAAEGFGEFTKQQLAGISLGFGMDYVTFTGDLTGVNFSSGRMGWLAFHRKVNNWQWKMFVPMFCDKAWEWFEQMAAIYGAIRAGQDIGVRWSVPRREMIDPSKETEATIEAYQNGLIAWADAVLEMGNDPDDQVDKMKADADRFKKNGLPPYTDKREMSAKATMQSESSGSNPKDNTE